MSHSRSTQSQTAPDYLGLADLGIFVNSASELRANNTTKTKPPPFPRHRGLGKTLTRGRQFSNEWGKDMYVALMSANDHGLADEIERIDNEDPVTAGEDPLSVLPIDTYRAQVLTVLIGLPDEFKRACLDGTLPKIIAKEGPNRSNIVPENVKARRSKCKQIEGDLERPVVYYITLCDENGYSTTGNQLYRGLLLGFKYTDWLEVYGDSDYPRRKEQTPELARFIKAVEASMPTARPDKAWKPALGEQLQDAERRYARSKAQLKHIRKSLKFLRRRLNQFYADNPDWDWDKPLPWYIFHVDFTRDVSYRRHQHETHRSSIPVMNLLDSLFRMLYPGSGICARFKVLPCLVEFRRRRRFAAIL